LEHQLASANSNMLSSLSCRMIFILLLFAHQATFPCIIAGLLYPINSGGLRKCTHNASLWLEMDFCRDLVQCSSSLMQHVTACPCSKSVGPTRPIVSCMFLFVDSTPSVCSFFCSFSSGASIPQYGSRTLNFNCGRESQFSAKWGGISHWIQVFVQENEFY